MGACFGSRRIISIIYNFLEKIIKSNLPIILDNDSDEKNADNKIIERGTDKTKKATYVI